MTFWSDGVATQRRYLDNDDLIYAQEKFDAGIPVPVIARMMNRPEHLLRKFFPHSPKRSTYEAMQ